MLIRPQREHPIIEIDWSKINEASADGIQHTIESAEFTPSDMLQRKDLCQ